MSIKLLAAALVFAGFATCASADITWTLSDVTLNNGDAVIRSFTDNDAVTMVDSFSLTMTGPASFSITQTVDSYLALGEIGMANSDFSKYVDLYANLTSAGGTVPITGEFVCPGCGTLVVNADTEVIGGTPEPLRLLLFGIGLVAIMGIARRKLLGRSVRGA
jgi:hypothetical protein